MPKPSVRRVAPTKAPGTPEKKGGIVKTGSPSAGLSPWTRQAHIRLKKAGLEDEMTMPWQSGELNPKVCKAERHTKKRNRKSKTATLLKRIPRVEPLPPPPPPPEFAAKYAPPSQDVHNQPPSRQMRSTPQHWREAPADARVGRKVLWLSRTEKSGCRATIVGVNNAGQCQIEEESDGSREWVDLEGLIQQRKLKYAFVGCGCPGVVDALCQQDLDERRNFGSEADLEVLEFKGMDSVLVRPRKGKGFKPIASERLLAQVAADVRSELNTSIAKKGGRHGGKRGVLKRLVHHASPLCTNYGCCYGHGTGLLEEEEEEEEGGASKKVTKRVAASKLATYTSTHSAPSKGTTWASARHVPSSLSELGRVAFKKLYYQLSTATRRCKGFNSFQSRIMKSHNFTRCHTDTRVDLVDGKPARAISQKPDTDVVICTIGDTNTFWRKEYPGRENDHQYHWLEPSVLLTHGSFWIWRTGHDARCDDWKYTHSVYWPTKGQPGYISKPDGERERIAIVMRCVQTQDWYATELPGRKLADA